MRIQSNGSPRHLQKLVDMHLIRLNEGATENDEGVEAVGQVGEQATVLILELDHVRKQLLHYPRACLALLDDRVNAKHEVIVKVNQLGLVGESQQRMNARLDELHTVSNEVLVLCHEADQVHAPADPLVALLNYMTLLHPLLRQFQVLALYAHSTLAFLAQVERLP